MAAASQRTRAWEHLGEAVPSGGRTGSPGAVPGPGWQVMVVVHVVVGEWNSVVGSVHPQVIG